MVEVVVAVTDGKTMPSSSVQHKTEAAKRGPVCVALVTVSDTRTPDTDVNAVYLREQLTLADHKVVVYHLIKDEPEQVVAVLEMLVEGEAEVILFNGGTGISKRDNTFDALSARLEKTLPGFGEIFRMLSYQEIGGAAMLSRATAGVYKGKIVISTPGSPAAVRLAWEKLIRSELQHLVWEIVR